MPRIMVRNGAILRRGGAIATSPRCCCPGDVPPLGPQTCCREVLGAWGSGTWPTVLYGEMSGFSCPALNGPFYMGPGGNLGIIGYQSNYLGDASVISCVPPQHDWTWRIAIECYGETWGLRVSDGAPWATTDFTTRYPVTLISCNPLQLRSVGLPNLFNLSGGGGGAIVLTSDPP